MVDFKKVVDDEKYLIDKKWRRVIDNNRTYFKDPRTKRLFILQHAVVVQEARDEEDLEKSGKSESKKVEKQATSMLDWDPYEHTVDEVFPPIKRRKSERPKNAKHQ
jgi:hypothetical protein